jgi:hypothetical protein
VHCGANNPAISLVGAWNRELAYQPMPHIDGFGKVGFGSDVCLIQLGAMLNQDTPPHGSECIVRGGPAFSEAILICERLQLGSFGVQEMEQKLARWFPGRSVLTLAPIKVGARCPIVLGRQGYLAIEKDGPVDGLRVDNVDNGLAFDARATILCPLVQNHSHSICVDCSMVSMQV